MQPATFVGLQAHNQESVLIIPKVKLGTDIFDSTLQFSHVQLHHGSLLLKDSTVSQGLLGKVFPGPLVEGFTIIYGFKIPPWGTKGATEMM